MIAARPVEDRVTLLAPSWEQTVSSSESLQLEADAVVSQHPAEASHWRPGNRSHMFLHQASGGRCVNAKGVFLTVTHPQVRL